MLLGSGVRDACNLKEGESVGGRVSEGEGEKEGKVGGGGYVRVMESECNEGVGCTLVGC